MEVASVNGQTCSSVNRWAVYRRVAVSWFYTVFTLVVMAVTTSLLSAIVLGITRSPRVVLYALGSLICMSVAMFLFSEKVINMLHGAYSPKREEFPNFYTAVESLWKGRWTRPRLKILKMGGPNACAYGVGLFGQCSIGVSEELYTLLDEDELKAVIAHEIAHIRCLDVGLMCLISILAGGPEQLMGAMRQGRVIGIGGPATFILVGILGILSKIILPIGCSAISQQREFAADALGALYVGDPEPLAFALMRLEDSTKDGDKVPSVLEGLVIRHPSMGKRLESLEALKTR